jgi:hypothetical protein
VEAVGALEDRYGVGRLAIECCQELKKWTQGDSGSWKKLAAVCRQMTCHAVPAQCKGPSHKGLTVEKKLTKDYVVQGALK